MAFDKDKVDTHNSQNKRKSLVYLMSAFDALGVLIRSLYELQVPTCSTELALFEGFCGVLAREKSLLDNINYNPSEILHVRDWFLIGYVTEYFPS